MKKKEKRKFFRPGTLEVPGTKITLKTQPYTNGVLFDTADPISSFRMELITLKNILNAYEEMLNIPGIFSCLKQSGKIPADQTEEEYLRSRKASIGSLKLLLDFLIESPTEILIKEQVLTETLVAEAYNSHIQ